MTRWGHTSPNASRPNSLSRPGAGARILVLGLTFKENVPDLRNSRVIDIITTLRVHGFDVDVHDLADADEAKHQYNVDLMPSLDDASGYHRVVGAVAHEEYAAYTAADFRQAGGDDAVIADVKGMWRTIDLPAGYRRWQLYHCRRLPGFYFPVSWLAPI